MKQQEKTKRTRERILEAAIAEFGSKGYDTASLNIICSENQISKGLIYHNFKGKDELYLQCVKTCYQKLTEYLKIHDLNWNDAKSCIQDIFALRQKFFQEYPYYGSIFFSATLQPPQHLLSEIHEIRREFDAFNTACLRNILHQVKLRDGITEDVALEYILVFGELFNGYFQKKADQNNDYCDLMKDHDGKLSDILNIMLYGLAEEKENESEC